MMGGNQTEKYYCKRGREGMSYYCKCLPAEDTCVSFWQNKRALQRKSEKCWFSKYFIVNSVIIICAHNLQRLEQGNMKMSTMFFSWRRAECISPYKKYGMKEMYGEHHAPHQPHWGASSMWGQPVPPLYHY